MREIIDLVAGDSGHGETFHIVCAPAAVLVYHVVYGACVVFGEQPYMAYILVHKQFLGHAHHLVRAVVVEYYHIVEHRAVEQRLIFLERGADKALLTVEIQFLVGLGHT